MKLVVNSGSEFKINNGNVNTNIVLISDDEINGTVNMEMGKLTLETLETEGTILASGGQFIVNGNNTLMELLQLQVLLQQLLTVH